MPADTALRFCGQEVSGENLGLIDQLIREFPSLSLTELSATICELLHWRRPNGGLKIRECYLFLERLRAGGAVPPLPAYRPTKPGGPQPVRLRTESDPGAPLAGPLANWLPLRFQLIDAHPDRQRFAQYIERYHYLGYRVPYGSQLRYFVHARAALPHPLACLLFTSAAWKMAPRDRFIGWSEAARRIHLPQLINHSRFLILPWVQVPHLASHILSLAARRLRTDWETVYGVPPVLLETLVDSTRFAGTCYRAANWIPVGATQGRGRMDRFHRAHGSPKQIFLFPLRRDWRDRLCRLP